MACTVYIHLLTETDFRRPCILEITHLVGSLWDTKTGVRAPVCTPYTLRERERVCVCVCGVQLLLLEKFELRDEVCTRMLNFLHNHIHIHIHIHITHSHTHTCICASRRRSLSCVMRCTHGR